MIHLRSIFGRQIFYYDPAISVTPLSLEAIKIASSINNRLELEAEYRAEFNASILDMKGHNPELSLHSLVEYLKLKCPSINKFCKKN